MKKWIGLITALVCVFSHPTHADNSEFFAEVVSEEPTEEIETTPSQSPKQVGAVSAEAASAARTSTAGKYILAGAAVALGVVALILVSRHHGHH